MARPRSRKIQLREATRHLAGIELAHLLGVDPAQVTRWKKAKCPVDKYGRFDPHEWYRWMVGEWARRAASEDEAYRRWTLARARKTEVEADRAEGEVIAAVDVERGYAERMRIFRDALGGMVKLAPKLAGLKTAAAVRAELLARVQRTIKQLLACGPGAPATRKAKTKAKPKGSKQP